MFLALPLICLLAMPVKEDATMHVWTVDPLTKVFRDAQPVQEENPSEVARGEYATWQVVVQSDAPIKGLTAKAGTFKRAGGGEVRGATARFVGYVPVTEALPDPPKDLLRKAPADFPDPLLEVESADLKAGEAHPIWVTVAVPEGARSGDYAGELTIAYGAVETKVPLKLKVYDVKVGKSRLWVTNWFGIVTNHLKTQPKENTPEWYALMERYAKNMAEHRQSVAWAHPINLCDFTIGSDGKLQFDFTRFDKWVEVFKKAGVIGRIEGGHIGGRVGDWNSQFGVTIKKIENGKVVAANVDPAGPDAQAFYSQFFPALVKHLKAKRWWTIYTQHLGDEPIAANIPSYRHMADLVHKYAPGLKTMDACHTKDLTGAIDLWVPQLNYFADGYAHYQERQKAGDEVWMYTCVYPQGEYANRFIELPLIKTRLLHWINYRYGATGYLHWGFNWWPGDKDADPYTCLTTTPGDRYLPAGDRWLVYPGKDGPLDSIRWEAMRDGIADYELLSMLGDKHPDEAMELAKKHILDFAKYDTDVAHFRATRRELLERLSRR